MRQDNCFKIYYIVSGVIHITTPEQDHRLERGRLYMIVGYHTYSYSSDGDFGVSWLHFQPRSLDMQRILTQLDVVVELGETSPCDFTRLLGQSDSIISRQEYPNVSFLRLESYLVLHITELIERYGLRFDRRAELFAPLFCHIDANLHRVMTLDEMSQTMCLSASYFHRLFQATFHMTPAKYIYNKKKWMRRSNFSSPRPCR